MLDKLMEYDPQAALATFSDAVFKLLEDKDLAYADPAEQAIVARLRELLSGKFEGWSIDLEWNRRENVIKKLRYGLNDDELIREGAIVPDLIVHRVGKKENLLVVEIKKSVNNDFDRDIWKLRGMTELDGDYAYAVGLHLVLDMPSSTIPHCEVYVDAKVDDPLTCWIREQFASRK